jgi:hypothetical protein
MRVSGATRGSNQFKPKSWYVKDLVYSLLVGALASTAVEALIRLTPRSGSYVLYGFADHRRYIYLYFIWVLGVPLFYLGMNRYSSQQTPTMQFQNQVEVDPKSLGIKFFGHRRLSVITVFFWTSVVWVSKGPPWGLDRAQIVLNNHETVHLKGIQAILSNQEPYIGAASSQYGPLIQRGAVWYMKLTDEVSLVTHREYWSIINFVGFMIIVVLICMTFDPITASTVNLLVVFSPSFTFFKFDESGFIGLFGWANSLRYLSALIVAMTFIRLRKVTSLAGNRTKLFLVGLIIGLLSLISQENLVMACLVIGILLVSSALVNAIDHVVMRGSLIWLGSGLLLTTLMYLLPYIFDRKASDFIANYLHIPLAVQSGYSNSDFVFSSNPCCNENLQYLPYFTFVIISSFIGGLLVVNQLKNCLRDGDNYSKHHQWAALCLWVSSTVVFSASLSRMDASHVASASILVAPWLGVAFAEFGRSHRPKWVKASAILLGIVTVTISILATQGSIGPANFRSAVSDAFLGRLQVIDPQSVKESISLEFGQDFDSSDFQDLNRWLMEIDRGPVYLDPIIAPSVGDELGLFYFTAKLVPFDIPYDEQMMAISDVELMENTAALQSPRLLLCTIVTTDPQSSSVDATRLVRTFEIVDKEQINSVWFYRLDNPKCS